MQCWRTAQMFDRRASNYRWHSTHSCISKFRVVRVLFVSGCGNWIPRNFTNENHFVSLIGIGAFSAAIAFNCDANDDRAKCAYRSRRLETDSMWPLFRFIRLGCGSNRIETAYIFEKIQFDWALKIFHCFRRMLCAAVLSTGVESNGAAAPRPSIKSHTRSIDFPHSLKIHTSSEKSIDE